MEIGDQIKESALQFSLWTAVYIVAYFLIRGFNFLGDSLSDFVGDESETSTDTSAKQNSALRQAISSSGLTVEIKHSLAITESPNAVDLALIAVLCSTAALWVHTRMSFRGFLLPKNDPNREKSPSEIEAEAEEARRLKKRSMIRFPQRPLGDRPRGNNESVWKTVMNRERTGGIGFRRMEHVPKPLVESVDSRFQRIPSLVMRMEKTFRSIMAAYCTNGDRCTCVGRHPADASLSRQQTTRLLEEASALVREALRVVCAPLEEAESLDPQILKPEQACQFTTCGGGTLLAEFLLCTIPREYQGRGKRWAWLDKVEEPSHADEIAIWHTWYHSLELLREVSLCSQGFSKELALNKDFVVLIFNLLRVSRLFDAALILCEEVVCAPTPQPFDLATLSNIDEIIKGFSSDELTMVCRVLVLLVHEPEAPSNMGEPPVAMALLRSRAKALNKNSTVQRNQRLLADKPILLRRLVHVLRLQAPMFPGESNDDVDENGKRYMTYQEINEALQRHAVFMELLQVFRNAGMPAMEFLQAMRGYMTQQMGHHVIDMARVLVDRYNMNQILGDGDWKQMPPPLDMEKISAIVEASLSGPRNESAQDREQAHANADDAASVDQRIASLEELLKGSQECEGALREETGGGEDAEGAANSTRTSNISPEIKHLIRSMRRLPISAIFDGDHGGAGVEGNDLDEGMGMFDNDGQGALPEDTAMMNAAAALNAALNVPGDEDEERAATERARLEFVSKQVEVLFMLAMLAGSGRKSVVNQQLAKFNIIGMLSRLFHKLQWEASDEESAHQRLHGANCQCNPIATIKIQFLRLVHNFCDREGSERTNKRLLLSSHDLRVTQLLFRHEGSLSVQLATELNNDPQRYNPEDPMQVGLLYKLVKVMMLEDPNSQHRFWIASTVEAYLRSGTIEEQLLFSAWGITTHILEQMLDSGFKGPGMLQTNFDLLGELLKFNVAQFEFVEAYLGPDRVQSLMRLAVTHLIDSNVFLRTVMLSLSHLSKTHPDIEDRLQMGRFLREHRITILQSLMTVITLETTSQENMCCLNTALLILMFAHRRGKLTHYLQAVDELEPSHREKLIAAWEEKGEMPDRSGHPDPEARESLAVEDGVGFPAQGSPALVNFRRLLWFWRIYYVQSCGLDSSSLAASSSIPFQDWLDIVELLCKDDGSFSSLLRKGQRFEVPSLLDLLN